MDVQLVHEIKGNQGQSCKKPLAILLDVQQETYLANIRNLITEQVSDVMPPGKYCFSFRGMIVSEAMEEELVLKQIIEKSDDPSSLSVVLLSIENFQEDRYDQGSAAKQGKVQKQSLSPVLSSSTDYKSKDTMPSPNDSTNTQDGKPLQESTLTVTSLPTTSLFPENPKKVFQLRSPTTTELRNLKIYTDAEIKKGRGQEPAYRLFWNEKVKQMAKNRKISNKEIYKRTNDEWRLHRSKLLVKDFKNMEEIVTSTDMEKIKEEETKDEPQAKKMKAGTVPSNVSRVKAASASLECLLAEINSKTEELEKTFDSTSRNEIQSELSQLQMRLDSSKSEMRKAQDTMRKNLKTKKSELLKYFS